MASNWWSRTEVPAAQVNADREAIHQIFSNLIENALKYAASGKKIVLGARAAESSVEFYVRDFRAGHFFRASAAAFRAFLSRR
jgi:K+-sensing histidine kinase KdpD